MTVLKFWVELNGGQYIHLKFCTSKVLCITSLPTFVTTYTNQNLKLVLFYYRKNPTHHSQTTQPTTTTTTSSSARCR